jgi:putative GTP pyrophosphokinase
MMGGVLNYHEAARDLEAFGGQLCRIIKTLLGSGGLKVHSVNFRVKEESSAIRKLETKRGKYRSCADLTDLLGIRVITYYPDEVDRVAEILEHEFSVDIANSIDKRAILDADQFGYLSKHYVLTLSPERAALGEYAHFRGRCFEVQIRSVLQHAWAEIEHDLGYKADRELPAPMRRRFFRIAGLLEVADEEFRALRRAIEEYHAYVDAKLVLAPESLPVDQATVNAVKVRDVILVSLEQNLIETLNAEVIDDPQGIMAAQEAKRLKVVGIENIRALHEALRREELYIVPFGVEWCDVPEGSPPIWAGSFTLFVLGLILLARMPADRAKDLIPSYYLEDERRPNHFSDSLYERISKTLRRAEQKVNRD